MTQFLLDHWKAIGGLTIGTVHALVLHRREIIALNDYSRNNGGLLRIVRDFLWIPKWNGQNKKEI
jgi:hypothetical protein